MGPIYLIDALEASDIHQDVEIREKRLHNVADAMLAHNG